MSKKKATGYLASIALILETHTQKEAAKLLNVSDRTIRRWKNEGSKPKPERIERIAQVSREEIKTRADAKKRKIPIKLNRMIGGSFYYSVKGATDWEKAMLLKYAFELTPKGYPPLVRFISDMPKSAEYPAGPRSTNIVSLEHCQNDNDFLDIIEEYNRFGRMLEVVRMLPWQVDKTKARKAKGKPASGKARRK